MQIELTGQSEQIVEQLIAGGDFASADEAVEFALRIFGDGAPAVEALQARLQEGLDDVAAGRVNSYESDEELKGFFDDVKRRGRERQAGSNPE